MDLDTICADLMDIAYDAVIAANDRRDADEAQAHLDRLSIALRKALISAAMTPMGRA